MSSNASGKLDAGLVCALKLAARGARGILINNHVQSAAQIRTQIDALAPFFDFISYDDLKERLQSGPKKKPFCLMTFDDGKAINATETAPELLRLGVPAVFYLVTGAMGGKTAFWFDRLTALRRADGSVELPTLAEFKAMPWRERDRVLDELCDRYDVRVDFSDPIVRGMSWDDAARLQREGFELGSHTVDHAILTVETEEEARRQIVDSRDEMVRHGLTCRSFAFPNGNATRALVEIALQAGFESTVTTAPVWIRRRDTLSCLPRLYLKERANTLHIHTKALAARTGFALSNPSGEGRRYLFTP